MKACRLLDVLEILLAVLITLSALEQACLALQSQSSDSVDIDLRIILT